MSYEINLNEFPELAELELARRCAKAVKLSFDRGGNCFDIARAVMEALRGADATTVLRAISLLEGAATPHENTNAHNGAHPAAPDLTPFDH